MGLSVFGRSSFAAGREQLIVRDLQEHLIKNGSGNFLETFFGVWHHDLEYHSPELVGKGQCHLTWKTRKRHTLGTLYTNQFTSLLDTKAQI